MRGIRRPSGGFLRRFRSAIWVAPLALVLSCADMPNAPKKMVHVRGTILDKAGQPMFAVAVYFSNPAVRLDDVFIDPTRIPPGEKATYYGPTGSNGTYDVLLPEGNYEIVATPLVSSGYARVHVPSIDVGENGARWDYRFSWPTVTVSTQTATGVTIPNSIVGLSPIYDPNDPRNRVGVWAARVGDVSEAVVPPGKYRMYVSPGGYEGGYPTQRADIIVAHDTTIVVTAGGYTIQARVLGPGGQLVENALVAASTSGLGAEARTDAGGVAVLHLPQGTYTWYVAAPVTYILPRVRPYVSITGDATMDFDISGTEWTGTVRRNGDGAPLAGMVVDIDPISLSSHAWATTDANGGFRLVMQAGTLYNLQVIDPLANRLLFGVPNVPAGADSTFDLYVDVPTP